MTHVAYLKRIVAGARRMWLKTEAMVPPTSYPWSPGMSDARSCRKRKNQTLLVSKECEMLIKNVITYFQKIFRVHVCGDKHLPSTVATLQDAWWMEDEKTETEKSVHSQVRVLCQGGQTGFKPRTEPPPQGPGGRCRGTYGLCPSSSDA